MAKKATTKPSLWTCPKCGHRFVTANSWHSCSHHGLAEHFKGADPQLRAVFNHYVRVVRQFGPVTVYAQKTRIVFQVRTRFAGAFVRKHWIVGSLWLKRPAEHPRFIREDRYGPRDWVYQFRLTQKDDLDPDLVALLGEAYAVGCQEM